MGVQEIIVHVKSDNFAPAQYAAKAASAVAAQLTGFFTLYDVGQFTAMIDPKSSPYLQQFVADEYARAKTAEERFREIAKQEENLQFDWQVAEGDAADLLHVAARLKDLIVVEQTDWQNAESVWDVAERMVLSCDKPAIIVPRGYRVTTAGKNVVVAWNDSQEAAQALLAARDFLRHADRVTVLVGGKREPVRTRTKMPKLDVVSYLKRHGIEAASENLSAPDAEAGQAIHSRASALGADLIVMGAYGRSRLAERLLGGATRHMLTSGTIPVLMAH